MKVLIDMPNIPKNDHQRWVLSHGGIVLDSLTNGEVFKAMYPNMEVYKVSEDIDEIVVKLNSTSHYRWFPLSWWNAKWGE